MNHFTIKDIENLSAIKAHTWRIWEQRYNIALPQRKDSNHRFYDSDNLKQILRISYLYHSGIKISRIAKLSAEEMNAIALRGLSREEAHEYYIKELLECSFDFDEERFERIFQDFVEQIGIEEAIVKVIYPYQQKIGVLWLTNHVIPSQEHFTSNIIRQKILVALDQLAEVESNNSTEIALFTPKDEQHEIPLLFIFYLLKKGGNKVIYFGKNISTSVVKQYAATKPFTHLMFHLVTNFTDKNPDEYLEELSEVFPDKQIIMSGTQVQYVDKKPANVRLLQSMNDILVFTNDTNASN
jgi:DNA-binding transcriptional MerR regulator